MTQLTEQAPAQAGIGGEELETLKALAEAATPGPWAATVQFGPRSAGVVSRAFEDETPGICGNHSSAWPLMDNDAEFIAACSPDVILALVSRLAELERDRENWHAREKQMRHAGAMLANCAFNLAQDGYTLDDRARASLDVSRREWDAAVSRAATPEGPRHE